MRDPAELDKPDEAVRAAGRPLLGFCAGMQLQARFAGSRIGPSGSSERGFLPIQIRDRSDLLRGPPADVVVFQDHRDEITAMPESFRVLASSAECSIQVIADPERRWVGHAVSSRGVQRRAPGRRALAAHLLRARDIGSSDPVRMNASSANQRAARPSVPSLLQPSDREPLLCGQVSR